MKMIVGLGNPGKEYEKTRHNIGFMVLDSYNKNEWKNKFSSYYYLYVIGGEKVVFIKPLTYMNDSGRAVYEFANYYDIKPNDILIVHDDLDLEFGKHKIKKDSSDGGHNGIKSIISYLKTTSFCRLKIGISNDKSIGTRDYVTSSFSKNEIDCIEKRMDTYINIINCFIEKDIETVMNRFNTKEK